MKIFFIMAAIGFLALMLGLLGFAIPNIDYKAISELADQSWTKPLIENYGTLIIVGFIFFGILFSITKTNSKKP